MWALNFGLPSIEWGAFFAGVAQSVERRTENPCVPSSILGPGTKGELNQCLHRKGKGLHVLEQMDLETDRFSICIGIIRK